MHASPDTCTLMRQPHRHSSIPPRPSTIPPPPRSSPRPTSNPPHAANAPAHADFSGATGTAVRFRPARLLAADLPVDLTCRFRCDAVAHGPYPVLDLGSAGLAAAIADDDSTLEPGASLDELELCLGDRPIWSGAATVVHATPGRIGARFDSGTLDLQKLRLEATLEGRLAMLEAQRAGLPAAWRAAVSDVRQLLEDARFEVEEFERADHGDPLRRREQEEELFEGLRARWGGAYYAAIAELHEQSQRARRGAARPRPELRDRGAHAAPRGMPAPPSCLREAARLRGGLPHDGALFRAREDGRDPLRSLAPLRGAELHARTHRRGPRGHHAACRAGRDAPRDEHSGARPVAGGGPRASSSRDCSRRRPR